MKLKFTSLLLLASAAFTSKAQMMISEDFTSPFSAANSGWVRTNLSASPFALWAQGQGTVFPAFNGGANDYYAVGYNSSSSAAATTLSNWLITPTVMIQNGAVLQFATRTSTNPASFADRLEVYSSLGTGVNVGSTATSVGTFSNLLVSVNPSLTATGYPDQWTVYTVTLSGVTSPGVGRVGFRYFVTNGGVNGTNSNYIGLDAVRYSVPCGVSVESFTVCAGSSTTLTAVGALSPASYTWSTNSNNSSIVENPASTTVYTLTYEENGNPCPAITSTITIGGNLSVGILASSTSVCAGTTVTLTAVAAASTFSWNTGATAVTTTVAPTANTVYSVGALNMSSGFCVGGNTIAITAIPLPSVNVVSSTTLLCTTGASTTVSFTGSGAAQYLWVVGASSAQGSSVTLNIPAPTPTTAVTQSIGLIGVDANGCINTDVYTFTISPQPTINVSTSASTVCVNGTVTLTASGADSYAWAGATTSTSNPLSFPAGSTAGNKQFTVTGTNASGCTGTAAFTQTVVVCNAVGIAVNSSAASLEVYPNPFINQINVSNHYGLVRVLNSIGQVVAQAFVEGSASINVSELPKGVYFVTSYNLQGENVGTSKMVKH